MNTSRAIVQNTRLASALGGAVRNARISGSLATLQPPPQRSSHGWFCAALEGCGSSIQMFSCVGRGVRQLLLRTPATAPERAAAAQALRSLFTSDEVVLLYAHSYPRPVYEAATVQFSGPLAPR